MKEIKAIVQPFMLDRVLEALAGVEALPGLTVSHVQGWGKSRAADARNRSSPGGHDFAAKVKVEIVVADELAGTVVDVIALAARTGNVGDGKIFVIDVADAVKIRTGEHGEDAV